MTSTFIDDDRVMINAVKTLICHGETGTISKWIRDDLYMVVLDSGKRIAVYGSELKLSNTKAKE